MDDIPKDDAKALQTELVKMKENKGLNISETWLYKVLVKGAYQILHKPLAILDLAKKAVAHLQKYESVRELAQDTREHIGTMIRMIQAYAKGEYTDISKTNIALSIAAIMYLASPIDLIPDFLAAGLLDDITLLLWVYKNYEKEIEGFRTWEDDKKIRIELPPKKE